MNEQSPDRYAEGSDHTYVSLGAPKYKLRITVDGKDVRLRFVNSMLKLPPDQARALDAVLHAPNAAAQQYVRKIDRALGEKISRQYQAEHGQKAVKGPFDSNAQRNMLNATLAARQISATSPEEIAKFKDELGGNMELQEHVKQVPHPAQPQSPVPLEKLDAPLTAAIPLGQPAATDDGKDATAPVAIETTGFSLKK